MYELTHVSKALVGEFKSASLASLGPLEERQFFDILARTFGTADYPTYIEDFPIWGSPRADTVRLVAIQRGVVHATLGLRVTEIKPTRQRIALIGAVATRPESQGQGIAGALLDDALSLIEKSGIKTTLLWGDPLELYAKRGFKPEGEQHLVGLAAAVHTETAPSGEIESEFTPLALPLMQARQNGIVRTFADAHWLSLHKNTRWAISVDGGGMPQAYLAWNRGVDLGGVVHEWAGPTELVRKLLAHAVTQSPELLIVGRSIDLKGIGVDPTQSVHSMPVALVRGPVPQDLWIWGLDGV